MDAVPCSFFTPALVKRNVVLRFYHVLTVCNTPTSKQEGSPTFKGGGYTVRKSLILFN